MQPIPIVLFLLALIMDYLWLLVLWTVGWGVYKWPFAKIATSSDDSYRNDAPKVTIFIPARNEQKHLRKTLSSVLTQDYPNYSIRFIDDQSTDGTWEIAQQIARGNDRVQLFRGKERPPGWLGKPWALHQITQGVTGDWFLFVDADVVLHPNTVSCAMDKAKKYNSDLLSLMATIKLESFWQKVIGITTAAIVAVTCPLAHINDPKKSAAFASGFFMLFRRSAYQAIGGHEGVKDQIVEDAALATKIKRQKLRLVVLSAPQLITTHFHGSFNEIITNLRKNFYGLFGVHAGKLSLYTISLLMWVIFPWIALFVGIYFSGLSGPPLLWSAVAFSAFISVSSLLGMTTVFALLTGSSPLYAFTVPLGVFVLLVIGWSNAWKFYFGSGIEWKGRTVASN